MMARTALWKHQFQLAGEGLAALPGNDADWSKRLRGMEFKII